MSAQAGIRYRDRRPVSREIIDCLAQGNAHLGPDRSGLYVGDGIAMLSFALTFDRLSKEERQPVRTTDDAVLTWDGRLDNRDDLLLRLHRELTTDYSDARLTAEALRRWRTDALRDLIGDWSLACWDARTRELTLARDYAGNRPLYYCCRPDFVAWSTAIEPLVEVCGVAGDVSEPYFARMLTLMPLGAHTPYRDIELVPAGHYIQVSGEQRVDRRSFTSFTPRAIRYRDVRDYHAHYRELLVQAVATRLRADGVVWSELSGGHDSTALVCTANMLVRASRVEASAVQPVSLVTPAAPESDESPYIESVERFCGLASVRLPLRHDYYLAPLHDVDRADDAGTPRSTDALAHAAGGRVLLSGEFGDVITAGTGAEDALLDRALHGQWRSLFRDSLTYCRESRSTMLSRLGAVIGRSSRVSRLVEDRWREHFGEMSKLRRLASRNPATIFGLRPEFARRALPERGAEADDALTDLPVTKRELALALRRFVDLNILNGGRSPHAIRVTYPYTHRPLLDLMLGMPARELWRPERHRDFVCAALARAMPEEILGRRTKGQPVPAVSRALIPVVMEETERGVGDWQLVARRFCDPAALMTMMTAFVNGSEATAGIVEQVLAAESMLRARRGPGRARSTAAHPLLSAAASPAPTRSLTKAVQPAHGL